MKFFALTFFIHRPKPLPFATFSKTFLINSILHDMIYILWPYLSSLAFNYKGCVPILSIHRILCKSRWRFYTGYHWSNDLMLFYVFFLVCIL